MATTKTGKCIDCIKEEVPTTRKASGKPLLCVTHRRARRFNRRTYTHTAHILNTYNLTSEEYWAIYEAQGRVCALCQRANGSTKKLSVDHDHSTGIIRGLICGHDNRDVLGHARDSIEFFERCIEYLKNPPAVAVIGVRVTPDMIGF